MTEVEAIKRHLTVLSARAIIRADNLPWWNFIDHIRGRWCAVCLAMAVQAIERGDHLSDQGRYISPIGEDQH